MKSKFVLAFLVGQVGWACPDLTGTFVSHAPTPETLIISQTKSDDMIKYHFIVVGKTEFDLVADGKTRTDIYHDYYGSKIETSLTIKCEGQTLVRHDIRLASGKWERRITFSEDSTIKLKINDANDLHLSSKHTEKFSGFSDTQDITYSRKKE